MEKCRCCGRKQKRKRGEVRVDLVRARDKGFDLLFYPITMPPRRKRARSSDDGSEEEEEENVVVPTRDPDYYDEEGTCVVKVENVLFRVRHTVVSPLRDIVERVLPPGSSNLSCS